MPGYYIGRTMKKSVFALWVSLVASSFAYASDTFKDFQLQFQLRNAGQVIDCQSSAFPLGKTGAMSRLKDARFYIHDIHFISPQGDRQKASLDQNEWQFLNLALVDLEDGQAECAGNKNMHPAITGKVAINQISAVEFTVGVPVFGFSNDKTVSMNHSSTEQTSAPLDIQAMAWNWQAGRKFMKIEVSPEGGVQRKNDTIKVWPVHLGSTGCTGNPANGEIVNCTSPNRFTVRLDHFDPVRDHVALDLAALFVDSDLRTDEGGAAGCMSSPQDPECPAIFKRLGLPLLKGETDNSGTNSAQSDQKIFSVVKN